MQTLEQRLFNGASALFEKAGLTMTLWQRNHAQKNAIDWAVDILTGKATEENFFDAINDTINDILAERETATI